MKIGKKIKSFIVVGALLVSLPVSALANGPEKKVIDYVAMGDSLAAGITPYQGDDLGYPDYLKQRFEQSQYTVNFDNTLAVPGYKTTDLIEAMTNEEQRQKIREAEFITIDIGANDILSVFNAYLVGAATYNHVEAAIGGAIVNLGAILHQIDQINSNAKVYVMGYYNPLPHVFLDKQPLLEQLLEAFNQKIEAAANLNGDTFQKRSGSLRAGLLEERIFINNLLN